MFTVQCGADMTKHQFGGHCNPPFPGKCRASSFPSLLTRRKASEDHYYKLMEPYFIAKRNKLNYSNALLSKSTLNLVHEGSACWQDETCKQPPQPASYAVSNRLNRSLGYTDT